MSRQAFGAALREQRKIRHMSQEALAFEAGLDRTYISLLELGQRSPTLDTLEVLSQAMGIKISTLVMRMEVIQQSKHDQSSNEGSAR
jgi:transcriptional regulator with XRE-family HTH domain